MVTLFLLEKYLYISYYFVDTDITIMLAFLPIFEFYNSESI